MKVRRILTEILLEVTTEEMESVAHEVLSKAKAKGTRNLNYTLKLVLNPGLLTNVYSQAEEMQQLIYFKYFVLTFHAMHFALSICLHVLSGSVIDLKTLVYVEKSSLYKEKKKLLHVMKSLCFIKRLLLPESWK